MITPLDAYVLFIEKYPESRSRCLVEWDDFCTCDRIDSISGDFRDTTYKIDKETGQISWWDIATYIEDTKTHKYIKEYSISLATYISAFAKALSKYYVEDADRL